MTYYDKKTGLWLDLTNMGLTEEFCASQTVEIARAFEAMTALEGGAIANPDENRMVGHYWLRTPELAPTLDIAAEITDTLTAITHFVKCVHSGEILGQSGKKMTQVLVVGVGGSSLGPAFVSRALTGLADKMTLRFLDNTDPMGMDDIFEKITPVLDETLVIVISKSGSTVETRNSMVETRALFERHGLDFFAQSVCITQEGSKLQQYGQNKWLAMFPMWDWVGGRTSVLSGVGILPLQLQGMDCNNLLTGAGACDVLTRIHSLQDNPAMLLALCWLQQTGGQGGTTMVMLPYKDRLELFAKYLQQLVMESLGKELDVDGKSVRQGLAVFGNKGSSDQHSYVQQLISGNDRFFVTFLSVLKDREGTDKIVGEGSTSGDYLQAFLLGTEEALVANGKPSMTITIPQVDAFYVGMLIALFERAVGYYASLVHINAYNQPAVELGKKAAGKIIALKNQALAMLQANPNKSFTAAQLAQVLDTTEERTLLKILFHLSANGAICKMEAETLFDIQFMA